MLELPKVKIKSNGMFSEVTVDEKRMAKLTNIEVDLKNRPHKVRLEMLAEVEIEGQMVVNEEKFTFVNGKKYRLVEEK
jgi:autotransporter translocation and assembly factor TamB